eukprot:3407503-Lingulodinium_polyedra.AAC.1
MAAVWGLPYHASAQSSLPTTKRWQEHALAFSCSRMRCTTAPATSTAKTTEGSSGSLSCARRRQSCAIPSPPTGMASAP